MINFRQTDLPISYEPVIVDFHETKPDPHCLPVTARMHEARFTEVMAKQGYKVYGTSVLSETHLQIVYLRADMYEKAHEDFLRSDRSSIGTFRVDPK